MRLARALPFLLLLAACGGARPGAPAPTPPTLAAAPALPCVERAVWYPDLAADSDLGARELLAAAEAAGVSVPAEKQEALKRDFSRITMWRMVRALLVGGNNNNFGAMTLPGRLTLDDRPVILYRTGVTPRPDQPGSCVHSLIHRGGVRHIVNLYAGEMHTEDLAAAECRAVEAAGGTCSLTTPESGDLATWRDTVRKNKDPAAWVPAMKAVARIIREQILAPGGGPPRGNILVHCGGGMHRTGMVFGVIERCLGRASDEAVIARYRRHVAWVSPEQPGGYEQNNVDFILGFDCALLTSP